MYFEILGEITEIEVIATGHGIDVLRFLRKRYSQGLWRKLKGVAQVRKRGGSARWAEVHWYEAHRHRPARLEDQAVLGLAPMKTEKSGSRFLLCVRNDDSDDLEPRKVYRVLPDPRAARDGFVRVIDESGEDYLYPSEFFVPVRLPVVVARTFLSPPNLALRVPARKVRRG